MDAVQLLKEDHQMVRDLYSQYKEIGVGATRQKEEMVRQICRLLQAHAEIEEESFYPKLQGVAPELVAEAKQEHGRVKEMIEELHKLEGKEEQQEEYYVKFNGMMEVVEHHVQEEEQELLPRAEKEMQDQLQELGTQMQQRKQEFLEAA